MHGGAWHASFTLAVIDNSDAVIGHVDNGFLARVAGKEASMIRDKSSGEARLPSGISGSGLAIVVSSSVVIYLAGLFGLIGARPLWFDEAIQLTGTLASDWHSLIRDVTQTPGGMPLGYLSQYWIISAAGFSVWTARLASALAGALALALFIILARRFGMTSGTVVVAVCLWMVCPLLLRYSLEGRPYMQGLFFALAAVLCQLQLCRANSVRWALGLAVCLAAAAYSQPFAIFAPLGFSLCNARHERTKCRVLTCTAYATAGLLLIPWLLAAMPHWREAIAQTRTGFEWRFSLALALIRECVGDGYVAAVPALLLAAHNVWRARRSPSIDSRLAMVGAILSSVVLALIADAKFDYFFAIRQLIYGVPFLLLLMADEISALWAQRNARLPVAGLIILFLSASITKDYTYLTDKREDWNKLSTQMSKALGGGCILLPEGDSGKIYFLFRPEIAAHLCNSTVTARRVIMARHTYTDPRAARLAESELLARGLGRVSVETVGFAEVAVFTRGE